MTNSLMKKSVAIGIVAILFLCLFLLAVLSPTGVALAEDPKLMILEQSVVAPDTETPVGSRSFVTIRKDATFTITYKLIRNDGLMDALFTPAYDRGAFELTSVAVDTDHWSLFNDYGEDEPMTLAEYIAAFNAAVAAGTDLPAEHLSFLVSYKGVINSLETSTDPEENPRLSISDTFLTITYRARKTISIPSDFSFGFLMTGEETPLTYATYGGKESERLEIFLRTGAGDEPLGADSYAFTVTPDVAAYIPGGQSLSFKSNGNGGYHIPAEDVAALELVFTAPIFDAGDENPYLADPLRYEGDQRITYIFYRKEGEEYVELTSLPTTPNLTDYYVKAVLAPTISFEGAETELVQLPVEPYYIDAPELAIIEDGTTRHEQVDYEGGDYRIASFDITYGSTLALTAIVEGEDAEFVASDVVLTYQREGGTPGEYSAINYDPIANVILVGNYRVTVSTADACVAFRPESDSTIVRSFDMDFTVQKRALVLNVAYEGGVATFSYETVNDDSITATYTVGEQWLGSEGSSYTASAGDVGKELTVTVTPGAYVQNYKATSVALRSVYGVTFDYGKEKFAAATNLPAAQYIFADCKATLPDEIPQFTLYRFSFWSTDANVSYEDESAKHDFDAAVTANVALHAVWEQMIYEYRFRVINRSARLTGTSLNLAYDYLTGFGVTETSSTYLFTKNTAIPTLVNISHFRVNRWWKVLPGDSYVYTEVTSFDVQGSVETTANAYYLAEMVIDLGEGDADGDGLVTVTDMLKMKKYLVGVGYPIIAEKQVSADAQRDADEQAAWSVALGTASFDNRFYLSLFDVNDDGRQDALDIFIVRDALATGYGYKVVTGQVVSGAAVVSEAEFPDATQVNDLDTLQEALASGEKAELTADITTTDSIVVSYDGDVYLDLGGKTLTADSLCIFTTGKLLIRNGKIATAVFDAHATGGVTLEDVEDDKGNLRTVGGTNAFFGWHVSYASTKGTISSAINESTGSGGFALMTVNIDMMGDLDLSCDGDVYLDLGGKTLTAHLVSVSTTGRLIIMNGTLAATSVDLHADAGIVLYGVKDASGADYVVGATEQTDFER